MTVYEEFARNIEYALSSDDGQDILAKTDMKDSRFIGHQDFQFDVSDGQPFFIRFDGATFVLHMGQTDRTSIYDRVYGHIDIETMWDLIEGRTTPADAIFGDRWKDLTGNSHPKRPFLNLLAVLLRIGQEQRRLFAGRASSD